MRTVLVAFVVLLAGCHGARKEAEARLARVEAESLRASAAVHVPTVGTQSDGPTDARRRLLVGRDAITLDETPPVTARWRHDADAFFAGTPDERLAALVPASPSRVLALHDGLAADADVEGGPNGYLLPALRDRLAAIRVDEGVPRELALVVGTTVPYRTLTRVLYSAGQADWDSFAFVVLGPRGECTIPLALPRLGRDGEHVTQNVEATRAAQRMLEQALGEIPAHPIGDPNGTPEPVPPAIALDVTLHAGGAATVHAYHHALAAACDAPAASDDTPTFPSLARHPLAACLAHVKETHADATDLTLSADADVPFSDVARAMADVRTVYPDFLLGADAQ